MVIHLIIHVAHVAILATTVGALFSLGRSLPRIKGEVWWRWVVGMTIAGLAGHVAVDVAHTLGAITDIVEYFYMSNLAGVLAVGASIYGILTYFGIVGRTALSYTPPLLIVIVTPIIFSAIFISVGTPITHRLLIVQTLSHGFVFWILLGYMNALIGKISLPIGLVPSILGYGSSIVFIGVGALYLYVTGFYLSGLTPPAIYQSYLYVQVVIGLVGASLSYLVVFKFPVFKVAGMKETFTGIEDIDRELRGKYPVSLLVMGPPGSGRTTLLTRLASSSLKDGDGVAYFTFDDTGDDVRKVLAGHGTPVPTHEKEGRLLIVTAISDPNKTERYSVRVEAQEISIMFSQVLADLKPSRKWVLIDSLTPIMDELGSSVGVKLLRTLAAKAKVAGISLLVSYNHTAFTSQETSLVQDCVDGVVELALQERGGKFSRLCRVVYIQGLHVSGNWFRLY